MFRKILVPLDRSRFAEQALGPARKIAQASGAGVDLVMVHEPRPLAGSPDVAWHADLIDQEEEYLADLARELAKTVSIATTHAVLPGEVTTAICKRTHAVGADLVVMTTHGLTGINRAWVGSVADGVLRRSGVPVLMLRPEVKNPGSEPFVGFRRVLVPLDGSSASLGIIPSAISLARCSGARVTLLQVVQPVQLLTMETAIPFAFPLPAEDEMSTRRVAERVEHDLTEIARHFSDTSSLDVDSHVLVSHDVGQAIIDFARESSIDAVAMSTHGRGASRLVFGSVTDKIMRAAALPMLIGGPSRRSSNIALPESEDSRRESVLSS
jgi:nucleotide-binding universal stress UspA family protein